MTVANAQIADIFDRLADLLEIEGANVFRVRAYRTAARAIQGLPHSIELMLARHEDLAKLSGIGKDLAGKIEEIVRTGRLAALEQEEGKLPGSLADLVSIPGLGPKRVKALYQELGVCSPADLKAAAAAGKVRLLRGFSSTMEAHILEALERQESAGRRFRLNVAEQVAEPLLAFLATVQGVSRAEIAGSYRRRRETVGDLDIVVTCRRPRGLMDRLLTYGDIAEVMAHGQTRASMRLRSGLQVDIRVVPEQSYGAALLYFTGSKAHNIAIRRRAVGRKLKMNEYGVFRGQRRIAGATEEEIYALLGLPYIEPELREDRGEIDAALAGTLPRLVTLGDIRGDLHVHTKASDGRHDIRQMAEAARERGYDYIAITDHTRHATIAHGQDRKRLASQIREIDRLNRELHGIHVLASSEVDILEDGSLDLDSGILAKLDFTVCAVHSSFKLSRAQQTERLLRAMDNPLLTILAHPSGRLIGAREAYNVDMERVIQGAVDRGCFLEVNGQPDRLDLDDVHCKLAKELRLKLALSTDAHSTDQLGFMRYSVQQARRGWIEAKDVLNTRSWEALKQLLRR